MTLPANIRVNTSAPFPALVKASGPLTLAKQNGIWTVGLTFNGLGALPLNVNPALVQLLVYNQVNNVFQTASVSQLVSNNPPATTITNANSPYTPLPTDTFLKVDTTGGAVTINLALAAARNGVSLAIKDYKGNAAVNNITIVPQGAPANETIDNFTHAAPLVLDANYDGVNLRPDTGLYIIEP